MSIQEAFKGAAIEWGRLPSTSARVKYVARTSRLFFEEIVGTITAVPFGVRSLSLLKTLKKPSDQDVCIQLRPDVRYGPAPRNTMDIYSPPKLKPAAPAPLWPDNSDTEDWHSRRAQATNASVPRGLAPVVLFVHGGVWATGSKWHYTSMATRLCQAGCVVCVLEYSLYPSANSDCMVREVSDALTFVQDNAATYGGDAAQVTLFGHSAGAHLCAMALLHRCAAAARSPAAVADDGDLCTSDSRMPARTLLAAGPYDISKHYEYEERRGVHMLSTMERAIGGWAAFRARSPAVLIASVVGALVEEPPAAVPRLAESASALRPRTPVAVGQLAAVPEREGSYEAEDDATDGNGVSTAAASTAVAVSDGREGAAAVEAGTDVGGAETIAVPLPAASSAGAEAGAAEAGVAEAGGGGRGVKRPRSGEQAREEAVVPHAEMLNPAGRQSFFQMFPLAGDAIAARAGHLSAEHAGGDAAGGDAATAIMLDGAAFRADAADAAERFAASLTVADVRRLPPVVLLSSSHDTTVPWHESAEMFHVLRAAGVRARHLMYDDVAHAGFVMSWRVEWDDGAPAGSDGGMAPDASPKFMRDTVRLVRGEVDV